MFLEKLISAEDKGAYIDSLSQEDKLSLYNEIHTNAETKSKELIAQETMKKKLEEEYHQELDKLKTLGINSEAELEEEITKLDDEIKTQIIDYASKLKEV